MAEIIHIMHICFPKKHHINFLQFKNERRRKMKEKRTKKESNKEEAKKEGRNVTAFGGSFEEATPREDLKIDWAAFVRYFNETLRRHGSHIAQVEFLSKGKKSRIQCIVNRYGTKKALLTAIEKMARSDFLNGRVKGADSQRSFLASFIWLTESDDHFEKVLNGYYDNPPEQELTPEEQRQLEQERYRAQQEARRAEVRRIDEEERARREAERDSWAQTSCTYEEYQRMLKNGQLKMDN